MNWDRYTELIALRDCGRIDEAIAELTKLGNAETDPLAKSITVIAVADGLVTLGHFPDARRKIHEACEILGPDHEYYPRAAFKAAMLDLHEKNSKGALRKLDEILETYAVVLHTDDHKDLLEEVQRNRGIALADLRRFRDALPILEFFRSEPYERERTLYYLGVCEFQLEDFGAAKRDFQEMLSLKPSSVSQVYAHEYLGRIFCREGQFARAKSEFEECLTGRDRSNTSEVYLLDWLIGCCKALNLKEDVARYTQMLKSIRAGGADFNR